jgi:two-component system, OmpR family, KDP operon response regulator KdpE
VITLTVRDAEQEKAKRLDAGADDYLTKPFSVPELPTRVRVALRRNLPSKGEASICSPCWLGTWAN